MKNYIFLFVIILGFISCSKSNDDLPNIIGKWTGKEIQTTTTDQIVTYEVTIDFELDFKENGEGTYKNTFNNLSEIHWVWDELEDKAWIIRELILSTGDEATTTTSFKIEKNTPTQQIWVNKFMYTNSDNEVVEIVSEWTFSK